MIRLLIIILSAISLLLAPGRASASQLTALWQYNLKGDSLRLDLTAHVHYHFLIWNDSGAYQDYTFRFYYGGKLVSTEPINSVPSSMTVYNDMTMIAKIHNVGGYFRQHVITIWLANGQPIHSDDVYTYLNSHLTQQLALVEQYE